MSISLGLFEATCCVMGCSSSPFTGQTFHFFPSNQEKGLKVPFKDVSGDVSLISRREAWMILLNMTKISFRTRVCSKHFEDSEFQKTRRPSTTLTIINKNMLRTCALPTLHLPKPTCSGDIFYTVVEENKNKSSASKARKICGVVTYVCCVADCLHNSLCGDCKLFTIPNNLNESKSSAWREFYVKMKNHVTKRSRICSCHFLEGELERGPVFYPSDFIDALGLSAIEKKRYLRKIFPSSCGTWDLIDDSAFSNSFTACSSEEEKVEKSSAKSSRTFTPVFDSFDDDQSSSIAEFIPSKIDYSKDPESFNCYFGLKNYQVFQKFLCIFETDYVDVLTEHQESVLFEDQVLLTLNKLKKNFRFSYLGPKKFGVSSNDAKGIFERCTAVMENVFCDGVLDVGRWGFHMTSWHELPECSLLFFPIEISVQYKVKIKHQADVNENSVKEFKSMLAITPVGIVTYVSPFFPSSEHTEEIIYKSKIHCVAGVGDIIVLDDKNIVQVKGKKNSHLILTPPSFTPKSQIQTCILQHTKRVTDSVLSYSILNVIPSDQSELSARILKIVCALNNFNVDPEEIVSYYLNSQKLDNGEVILEEFSHSFIHLLPF